MDTSQLDFPFPLDAAALTAFLTSWCTLKDEEDRLKAEKCLLKEQYADAFPMRGVLTALKVARATLQLEAHPKEGMARRHLAGLVALGERHLDGRQGREMPPQRAVRGRFSHAWRFDRSQGGAGYEVDALPQEAMGSFGATSAG